MEIEMNQDTLEKLKELKLYGMYNAFKASLVNYNRNSMTVNGVRRKAQHMRFNMIFNERAAVVYNISPRYFGGATLVMNNSVFDDDVVVVNQNKWYARAFLGLRL